MGQAGSAPHATLHARRSNTLPHEPPRHAPKVTVTIEEKNCMLSKLEIKFKIVNANLPDVRNRTNASADVETEL